MHTERVYMAASVFTAYGLQQKDEGDDPKPRVQESSTGLGFLHAKL